MRFLLKEKAAEPVLWPGFVACSSPGCHRRYPAVLHDVCRHHPEFQQDSLVLRWDDPIPWKCLSPRAAEGRNSVKLRFTQDKTESQSIFGLKQVLRAYIGAKTPFLCLFCCKQICTAVVSQLLLFMVFEHFPPNSGSVFYVHSAHFQLPS